MPGSGRTHTGMTKISATKVQAREDARQDTGEFGFQQRPEAVGVELAFPVSPREAGIEAAVAQIGEGIRPHIEERFDQVSTPEGTALLSDYYVKNAGKSYDGHIEADFDHLAELGYDDIEDLCTKAQGLYSYHGLYEIDKDSISPERLDVLVELKPSQQRSSDWESEAYKSGDLDALRSAIGKNPLDTYRAIAASLGPEKTERLWACLDAGVDQKNLIEAEDCDPATLGAVYNALPKTYKNLAAAIVRNGHDEQSLKTYGAKLASDIPLEMLQGSACKPAHLKAVCSAHKTYYRPPEEKLKIFEDLVNAGYTKASHIRDMVKAAGLDDAEHLIRHRKLVEPATAAAYADVFLRGQDRMQRLDEDELKAVGVLARFGYEDPKTLPSFHLAREAQWNAPASFKPLPAFASLIASGISKERAQAMSKAGIPVEKIAEFKDAEDIWEAGRPFREAYDQYQARSVERGWVKAPAPWQYGPEDCKYS